VGGGGGELGGEVGAGGEVVLLGGGPRHDLQVGDRQRALTDGGADAVGAGVAAADDDDVLAGGEDRLDVAERLAADAAVLLRQKKHCGMHAGGVAPRGRQGGAPFSAPRGGGGERNPLSCAPPPPGRPPGGCWGDS